MKEELEVIVERKGVIENDFIPVNKRNLMRVAPFGARFTEGKNVKVIRVTGDIMGAMYRFFTNKKQNDAV